MSYAYNDAEMILGTQIAYMDIPEGETVGQYIDAILNTPGIEDAGGKLGGQYKTCKNFVEMARKNNITNWENWTIMEVGDCQNTSGMYGCLIDTGNGDAIIGFRGSESYDLQQKIYDWAIADFGMLSTVLTQQQYDAENFTRKIWEKYGDTYDSFSFTGHSLGGNLAEHSSIVAPDSMKKKIDHCISFDGPGFSKEYIIAHSNNFEKASSFISHYEWSIVGSLLTQPAGIDDRVIQATEDEPRCLGSKLEKHHTRHVELVDGSVLNGKRGLFETETKIISHVVDLAVVLPTNLFPSILREFASDRKEELDAIVKEVKRIYNDIRQRIFGHDYLEDYYVDIDAMKSMAEELRSTAVLMNSVVQSIDDIQKNLKYDSPSAAYYKSNLWLIKNSLSGNVEKIRHDGNITDTIANIYDSADNEVSGLYLL